jgi:hypothetical protein
MPITLPSTKELLTGDLAVNGNWVVANLDTAIPWPTKVVKVTFRNRAIFLLPPTSTPLPQGGTVLSNETYPAVAVNLGPGGTFNHGMLIISHYLSSLAWVERHGARVEHWSGGNLPRPMGGRPRHPTYTQNFYCPYLPDTIVQRARWALAFYREGLSLNHVAYQCLSFFKILNIFLQTGSKQKQWINGHVGTCPSVKRQNELHQFRSSTETSAIISTRQDVVRLRMQVKRRPLIQRTQRTFDA